MKYVYFVETVSTQARLMRFVSISGIGTYVH